MFEELDELFESSTIKPSYDYVHILLALFIFEENPQGIGRYRLKENLLIGSGTARSLIEKLNEVSEFIQVIDDNIRKGHILTKKGRDFLKKIKEKIKVLSKGDVSKLKKMIINYDNPFVYFTLIKHASDKINYGIEQRDAAIKVDGLGATCLIYDGVNLKYPPSPVIGDEKPDLRLDKETEAYFKEELVNEGIKIEEGDVIIIGLGDSSEKARLVALNASLTLL